MDTTGTDREMQIQCYRFGQRLGEDAVLKVIMERLAMLDPDFTPAAVKAAALAFVDQASPSGSDVLTDRMRQGAEDVIDRLAGSRPAEG